MDNAVAAVPRVEAAADIIRSILSTKSQITGSGTRWKQLQQPVLSKTPLGAPTPEAFNQQLLNHEMSRDPIAHPIQFDIAIRGPASGVSRPNPPSPSTGNPEVRARITARYQTAPGEVSCTFCLLPTKACDLDAHIQSDHPERYPYHNKNIKKCPTCAKDYTRRDALLDHLSNTHNVDSPEKMLDYNYMKRKRYEDLISHLHDAEIVIYLNKQRVATELARRGQDSSSVGLGVDLTTMWPPQDVFKTNEYRNAVGTGVPIYRGKTGHEARKFWVAQKLVDKRLESNRVIELELALGL